MQLSFLCVQIRCNYMYCSISESFAFLIINRQWCCCPLTNTHWLVSLRILLEWPFLARGIGVAGLSSSPLDDEGLMGKDFSFPCALISAYYIGSLQGICQVGGTQPDPISSLLSPLSLFTTDVMHRSHDPGHCSYWSDLCCTRHFFFEYPLIKHEVRSLLSFRDE